MVQGPGRIERINRMLHSNLSKEEEIKQKQCLYLLASIESLTKNQKTIWPRSYFIEFIP
jgi:hypothetical protein